MRCIGWIGGKDGMHGMDGMGCIRWIGGKDGMHLWVAWHGIGRDTWMDSMGWMGGDGLDG